ncbi:hypothetical protein ALC56_12850 [Trachymyrmex septentrionalis]|uniref:Uncharacterized protein n=1 Tax=Trachymyrmex septentrionalis TaxID=34720 RepID=A0A195EWY2_9HYME|nr:hypothetical protein ALC56_12850 [Trachymyrmex septentrionalis]
MCSKCSECCQGSRHSVDASPTPGSDSDASEEEWNPDGKGHRQSNDTGEDEDLFTLLFKAIRTFSDVTRSIFSEICTFCVRAGNSRGVSSVDNPSACGVPALSTRGNSSPPSEPAPRRAAEMACGVRRRWRYPIYKEPRKARTNRIEEFYPPTIRPPPRDERRRSADPPSTNIDYKTGGGNGGGCVRRGGGDGGGGGGGGVGGDGLLSRRVAGDDRLARGEVNKAPSGQTHAVESSISRLRPPRLRKSAHESTLADRNVSSPA